MDDLRDYQLSVSYMTEDIEEEKPQYVNPQVLGQYNHKNKVEIHQTWKEFDGWDVEFKLEDDFLEENK